MICIVCGKATEAGEFFTSAAGQRKYIHLHCMVAKGEEAIASGICDDIRIAISGQLRPICPARPRRWRGYPTHIRTARPAY
jgi:hypothetical protein